MSYWLIVTDDSASIPPGTSKVLERVLLSDGLVRWFVEGAGFMSVLPSVVKGVISVKGVHKDAPETAELLNRW